MASINVVGCLGTYWYAWTINGIGSVLSTCVSLGVTILMMKVISNLTQAKPSMPKKPRNEFAQYRSQPPAFDMNPSSWNDEMMMGPMQSSYA